MALFPGLIKELWLTICMTYHEDIPIIVKAENRSVFTQNCRKLLMIHIKFPSQIGKLPEIKSLIIDAKYYNAQGYELNLNKSHSQLKSSFLFCVFEIKMFVTEYFQRAVENKNTNLLT